MWALVCALLVLGALHGSNAPRAAYASPVTPRAAQTAPTSTGSTLVPPASGTEQHLRGPLIGLVLFVIATVVGGGLLVGISRRIRAVDENPPDR